MSVQVEDALGRCESLAHMLLVHDGSPGNHRLEAGLLEAGYFVTTASAEEEALRLLVELRPDLLVMGTDVVGMEGWRLSRLNRPGQPQETTSEEINMDQVMAQVEGLVRTSLLPPPLDCLSA